MGDSVAEPLNRFQASMHTGTRHARMRKRVMRTDRPEIVILTGYEKWPEAKGQFRDELADGSRSAHVTPRLFDHLLHRSGEDQPGHSGKRQRKIVSVPVLHPSAIAQCIMQAISDSNFYVVKHAEKSFRDGDIGFIERKRSREIAIGCSEVAEDSGTGQCAIQVGQEFDAV